MVDTRFSVSLQIMVTLAVHGQDQLSNSSDLARVLKTNPTFVRKLTARLVEAGLVESFRGKNGGIRLARLPKDIGLDEIYCVASSEKPLFASSQKPVTKACKVSCSMDRIFCEVVTGIEGATKSYLAKKTLSDLINKVQ